MQRLQATPHIAAQRGIPFIPDRGVSELDRLAGWVSATGDNQRMPFVIVDKKRARVAVFEPSCDLRGMTSALMGAARGDHSVQGVDERSMASIRPEEPTTPAGRFVAELGHNSKGEDIVWVDYDAAVSLHRVRATNPAERRRTTAFPTAASTCRRLFTKASFSPLSRGRGARWSMYCPRCAP